MDKLGRYEILEELGSGAMGTVYRARDPKIGRIVALKTIRAFGARPGEDDEYRRRFFREAQAAGNLSHPGIVTIYDVCEEESTQVPYIVMEYIAGSTLDNLLTAEDGQRPPVELSINLVRQLAEALDYAHAQNIVHRDIKPANIIVTPEARAKITDFGVARQNHSELTVEGQLVGTPAYMSPEQLKGEPVDGRSDLFSLGVILYWLLTAEKPFSGDGTAVIAKILYQEPPPVTQFNSGLGSEYERVVSKALAKDPSARYQRGKEFAEELARLPIRESAPGQSPLVGAPSKESRSQKSAETPSLQKTVLLNAADLPASSAALEGTGARSGKPLPRVALAVIGLSALFSLTALIVRTINRPAPAAAEPISTDSKLATTKNKPVGMSNTLSETVSKPAPSVPALAVRKSSGTANLQILCWHDFSSAELSVWVAGELVYQSELQVVKKRSGGYLATTVQVPAGKRTVRVQVKSNHGKYDRSRTIDGEFSKDREATLEITCDEFNNSLLVAWQKLVDP